MIDTSKGNRPQYTFKGSSFRSGEDDSEDDDYDQFHSAKEESQSMEMEQRPDLKPETQQMSNRERLDRSTRGGASGIRYSRYSSDADSQSDDDD